jgi:streptogramin lyase
MLRRPSGRAPRPVLVAAALAALLTVPATTTAAEAPAATPSKHGRLALPDRIELPDGFLPEGIAVGLGPYAWFGSRADGDIYRADLVTGEGEVVSQGPGTASVGLHLDRRGRLFVAGGDAGDARVVDARTGELLASYALTDQPSFVNDVVVAGDAAWFTDSLRPVLYRLDLGRAGALPDGAHEVPLGGDWEQVGGFNANGITATPDGRALLVINSTTGVLHRVDPATGTTTAVDLGGETLTAGDGMLLLGRTLYVVRNRQNVVAVVELDRAGTRGTVTAELTSEGFDVPTTVDAFAGALYLPNARFTTPQEPGTDFWATRLPLRP